MIVPFASALLNQVPVVQNTDGRCSTIDAEILRFENGLNEPGALFRYGSYWIPSPTMSRNLPPLVTEKEVRRSLVRESDVGEHKTDVRIKGSGHDPAGLETRAGNWWHDDSLPGSTTIVVRAASGRCWTALTNTRTEPSNEINAALNQMMGRWRRASPNGGVRVN